jgi:hypothetical protein
MTQPPRLKRKGGEISVVFIFCMPNMHGIISPPGQEEWIPVRNEREDEVVDRYRQN